MVHGCFTPLFPLLNEGVLSMRKSFAVMSVLSLMALLGFSVQAQDKKTGDKVDFKGTLCCGKCELKIEGVTKCLNAIKVTESGKEVIYLLDDKGAAATYHAEFCQGPKGGTVKCEVVEKKKGAIKGYKYVKPAKDGVKVD